MEKMSRNILRIRIILIDNYGKLCYIDAIRTRLAEYGLKKIREDLLC